MAANPKRKGLSTLPVYLPKMSVKRKAKAKDAPSVEASVPRIYVEGAFSPSAAEKIAEGLTQGGIDAHIEGDMIASLPRQAQLKLRHAVAAAARELAAARVRDRSQGGHGFPLRGEVDEEEEGLHANSYTAEYEGKSIPLPDGLAYNGAAVQAAFRDLLPAEQANIVATSRHLVSWDEGSEKWVPQTVVPGNPILVGVSDQDGAALASEVKAALP